nr:PREDICTED: uncharacterized protein LOC105663100 [Megachile rotundata]
MKNITQYFMDTIKANDSLPVHSNSTKKKEIESRKYSKDKYNYTTVEISKKNSGKDTCNMIESSSDIIDRNSNPFKEINIYQTSKQYFSSKLSSTKLQKHVDLSLETNDVLNINKKQIKNDSIHISTDKKRYIKKSKRGFPTIVCKRNHIEILLFRRGIWDGRMRYIRGRLNNNMAAGISRCLVRLGTDWVQDWLYVHTYGTPEGTAKRAHH